MSLTDPCLPKFWSKSYKAMAGFVAMISVFLVVCVEMFFAMKGAKHVHTSGYDNLINEEIDQEHPDRFEDGAEASYARVLNGQEHDEEGIDLGNMQGIARSATAPEILGQSAMGPPKENEDADVEDLEPYTDRDPILNEHSYSTGEPNRRMMAPAPAADHEHEHEHANPNAQRQLLQCLLLEAGILFHSIFIGMAVSVATGTSFVVLLVAISFHQTFEGFALGSRIASLIPDLFSPMSTKPWLMCLAYGTTTPIGQAIGLFMHNLYDPASTAGLLMVGITNAISSGLLLFAGLVELLAEDFLSEASYESLRGRRRIEACVAVAAGALLMAMVGAFA